MTSRQPTRNRAGNVRAADDVDGFMSALVHPAKREIEAIRHIILGAAPGIQEGIKWNAPSFRRGEYFATFNLRAKDGVQVIFHLGAKVKDNSTGGLAIADPSGLLQWLAKDRASARFADMKDVTAKRGALASIVRAWIENL